MSDVALWQIIEDWLPIAGWQILKVWPPAMHTNGDMLPAFIVNDREITKVKTAGPNNHYPQDQMCAIYDNEIAFFNCGTYGHPLKASDPMFFEKLNEILLSLFSNSEWYSKKMGWTVTGHKREKIWPK